jgi:hypothetical protein
VFETLGKWMNSSSVYWLTLPETPKFSWAGLFSSARVTDENVSYFRGPAKIFVGRPTKIRKLLSSASGPTKLCDIFVGRSEADENKWGIFVGRIQADENKSLTGLYFRRP